jgi:hypothetical protein
MPPHISFWRSILILSSYLSLGLPSALFPSGFTAKNRNKPDKLSSEYFPGVWVLIADVSELCVGSIFTTCWRWKTQSSETSAFNTQTPGKCPKDNLSLLQHGESLKTRTI